MRRISVALAVLLAGAQGLLASNLDLHVQSGGQSSVKVGPGASVPYVIVGELTDNSNQGLAMFSIDLTFSGGPLAPASPPSTSPMVNFDKPAGLTNPAGFGGTPVAGVLRQVGGAQNTINNVLAPYPSGSVLTGVALNGDPEVLVTGSLTTPYKVGTYALTPGAVMANAIRLGETGVDFWRVDPAGPGVITPLSVTVEALTPGAPSVPVGQPVSLLINAGPANAGRHYRVLGCTTPGINKRLIVPLMNDAYYHFTSTQPNSAILQNSDGTLSASGQATAIFTPDGTFSGLTVRHAFYVSGGATVFVSNVASVLVTPSPFVRK
jgi:hypothetical protein